MSWWTLLALALALAMDAFAVALATGLALRAVAGRQVFRLAFHFGVFQALMPVAGWLAGHGLRRYIAAVDHWIAFGLLASLGLKMAWGALRGERDDAPRGDPTKGWSLIVLSIATSIDALAVGLTLAFLRTPIVTPAMVIGLVAGVLTTAGMLAGGRMGRHWGSWVEVLGGGILLVIGCKILVEHLSAPQ